MTTHTPTLITRDRLSVATLIDNALYMWLSTEVVPYWGRCRTRYVVEDQYGIRQFASFNKEQAIYFANKRTQEYCDFLNMGEINENHADV